MNRTKNWYVICTRPRWELKIFKALLEQGIEAYCPIYTSVRQWSDRKKKISKPYFNSYVFVRLEEAERDRVFGIPGVVRYVFWLGKAAKVQESEIQLLKEYLDGEAIEDARIEQLAVGEEVRFARGALKDRTALVEKIGSHKVRLVLPVLGYRITARMADLVP
ncbi:MAG: UpxY family transcription antiterminator [Eudoraea sp.]|uniref:transcription termination/antitermination protein NusG n=1 Tax=Eudoraea sp. TaxID=1979955 RepID=UPI003C70738E